MKNKLSKDDLRNVLYLIQNEINSDLDMITMTKSKEKNVWKEEVKYFKKLEKKFEVLLKNARNYI